MSGQDLYNELAELVHSLDKAVYGLGDEGRVYAKAEHDYKVALSKKMLTEREKGTPVTIIQDICKGDENIANLRFERQVAETTYKAAYETINSLKLRIKLVENQIGREWGK